MFLTTGRIGISGLCTLVLLSVLGVKVSFESSIFPIFYLQFFWVL